MGNSICEEGSTCYNCFSPCIECFQGLKECCITCGQTCEACYHCCGPICSNGCSKLYRCLAVICQCCGNPCLLQDKSKSDINQVLTEFTSKGKCLDKYFGQIELLEHNTSKEVIALKCFETFLPHKFDEEYRTYEQRKELQHQNILQTDMARKQEHYFCSNVFRGYLFFDFILMDLAHDFDYRSENQLQYKEEDFWKVAEGCINGLRYLYEKNKGHGSVRMSTVYLNCQGIIKIGDPTFFKYGNDYQKVYSNRDKWAKAVFLSPELLNALDKKVADPPYDREKADVFAVAMILLSIGTLRHGSVCYNYDQACIYEDRIKQGLDQIKQNYHDSLYFMLGNMLSIKPDQRPTFLQLSERLSSIPKAKKYQQSLVETVIAPPQQLTPDNNLNINYQPQTNPVVSIYADTSKILPQGQNYDMYGGGDIDFGLGAAYQNIDFTSAAGIEYGLPLLNEPKEQPKAQIEQVKEKLPDGSKYVGQKKGGVRHGQGKFIHTNGSYYDGQWKDNKMSGKGYLQKLYDQNQKIIYDGNFKDDKYHGHGIQFNYNSINKEIDYKDLSNIEDLFQKYDGEFKNDEREGFGTLIFFNGDKFSGNFKNGIVHGHGNYFKKQGSKFEGQWVQGKMK